MRWDGVHNGMLDVFDFYRARRNAFLENQSAQMTGMQGSILLTGEQMAVAGPRMAELNSLLDQLREQTAADTSASWTILESLFQCFRREFQLTYTIAPNPAVQMPNAPAPTA